MGTATRIGRLSLLAAGLGIGAALAATPGVASADDIQISIDGFDLFPTAGNTASAVSGMGDIAIAIGPNSDAFAEGGFGDYASAFSIGSTGATAVAGDGTAGATGNNFDFASAVGNFVNAEAGDNINKFPDTTGSSFDFANAVGGDGPGAGSSAFAGFNGSGDSASAVGDNVLSEAGLSGNAAAPANFDSASVLGNLTTPTTNTAEAIAGSGGSNDLAFVTDPFGTIGSEATAGLGNNFDLAGALGDNLNATATGMDFVFHILPFF